MMSLGHSDDDDDELATAREVAVEQSLCFTGDDDDDDELLRARDDDDDDDDVDDGMRHDGGGVGQVSSSSSSAQQRRQRGTTQARHVTKKTPPALPQALPREEQPSPSPTAPTKKGTKKKKARKSWWTQLRVAYERLVASVIRPPRAEYCVEDLGPRLSLRAGGSVTMERRDFSVTNARGEALAASLWRPTNVARADLVVYLHSNSSCRLAAVRSPVLEVAAAAGCALLVFDFAACGKSQGDYVTLGLREADDVRSVLDVVLRQFFKQSTKVFLWGRSMGAVSALLYHSQQICESEALADTGATLNEERRGSPTTRVTPPPSGAKKKTSSSSSSSSSRRETRAPGTTAAAAREETPPPPRSKVAVVGLVLDSPFSSIQQLVEDVRKRALPRTPRCCVSCVVCALRRSTRKRAKADVMSVSAIRAAESASAPALFLAANADALAPPPTHTRFLAGVYGARCELIDFDGAHNSPRPKHVYDAVLAFLLYRLDDDHPSQFGGPDEPGRRQRPLGGGGGGGLSSSSSSSAAGSPSSSVASTTRRKKRLPVPYTKNNIPADAATLLIAKE